MEEAPIPTPPARARAAVLAAACAAAPLLAAVPQVAPDRPDWATEVRPILERSCFPCHGETKQKGGIRLDRLSPDFGADSEGWHTAPDMLTSGDMPPRRAPQPTDEERRSVVRWIRAGLADAARAEAGERRTVLRRLTREQYTYSLQDVLGVEMDFGRVLPPDALSESGFSNNGAVLAASPLHVETYQEVARAALDRAIHVGERPEPTRYRVRFGAGIGEGHVAARIGGYQSVPLDPDDFVVEILDGAGRPREGATDEERSALDAVRRRIGVGLRGSSQDRFRVVDEGLVLYSALPRKEKVPMAWQGPSPNVKLELQRAFPERGDFELRVRASRGRLFPRPEELLVVLDDPVPRAELDADGVSVVASGDAIVLPATGSDARKNVTEEDGVVRPVDVPQDCQARLRVVLPEDGYYQVDLVHPPAPPEGMPSVRLRLGGHALDQRIALDDEQLAEERIVTPLGAVFLRAGAHHLVLGGPFFVGFSELAVTPLADDHPLVRRLSQRADELARRVADDRPGLRAFVGTRTDDGMDYLEFDGARVVEAPLGDAEEYVFRGRLEDLPIPEPESGDTEILSGILVVGIWNDHLVKSARETGPPLLVESLELEAPVHPVWPPRSHTRIFFDSPDRDDEEAYTRQVLARFLRRAFRRPVSVAEVERYVDFWRAGRAEHDVYEESVREALVAALCSPHFLFLVEPVDAEDPAGPPVPLPEHALASRLSYFLWSSPPDERLRALARQGRLRDVLGEEVERMLDDPRAVRFLRRFAREWLRLDRFENMTIDADTYPAFTRFVKRDMEEETVRFLHEVVRSDREVFALIDSDFAMLNQNLAEFYGVDGVEGPELRPVPLPRRAGRGGLLSQGAFLAGHSDGVEPHPIKRAVWVKEKILGDPPPPPPPNVPDLDPDAPGFAELTLKEQLELHRDSSSCMDCHAKLDPYGVVFEEYDAVGLRRSERKGRPVDAATVLPDGTPVEGVAELKEWILDERRDAFVASLVEHLWAYALGRDVHFADEEELAAVQRAVQSEGYRMRSVIRHIVLSPSFTHR